MARMRVVVAMTRRMDSKRRGGERRGFGLAEGNERVSWDSEKVGEL